MSSIRKITARDKPEILARSAALHEEHLRLAIGIALRRAVRSHHLVRELLAKATIEGLAHRLNAKASAVCFDVPQMHQVWHQIFPWQDLVRDTPAESATWIALALRENIRRNRLIDDRAR